VATLDALAWAHPVVAEWFEARFGSPTEPQLAGWPHILEQRDVLISAPTGSGKTLAAFLACIDTLVRRGVAGTLTDRTSVLYISPLKALGNDVQRNLDGPLADIVAAARRQAVPLPDVRTAVRTGDTLMPARQAMLRRPPHILVTTPESFYILLTTVRGREMLRAIETVIVDEIHAMADDKRGVHLALSLERLDALVGRPVPRIGLSATQHPIELVADFLGGAGRARPVIVEVPGRRVFDLAVEVPGCELGPIATEAVWDDVYERLAALARLHRSTLIFVNTRRAAERVAHRLAERLGADRVAAHHGSLARRMRLDAEARLKAGQLSALVATASLELGIDVGAIDLVCQVGSPRRIAVAVQRIGRAGHWRGAVPKARLFATTRDELVECAAVVRAVRRGALDRLIVPDAPLDILMQQLVACAAAEDWSEDDLFALVRRALPYRDLPRRDFDAVVALLSDGIAARRGRYGVYLHRDRVHGRVRGRRGARLTAVTNGGAIPDIGLYSVIAEPEGTVVGTVDEDFAIESHAGDVMLLGSTSWRIRRVGSGRVQVADAHGAAPTIPFWRGEAPARTPELSAFVSGVREDAGSADAADRLADCGLDQAGLDQVIAYVAAGRAVLGAVPGQHTIVAERFFDEGGGMQLVIHAPFGARINKAWGLALRKRFCRSFNFELQAAATEDGLNIALAEQHSFPLGDVFHFLSTPTVQSVLEQAVLPSPIFGARWRWAASRALALPRFQSGARVPIHLQRLRADDLLASVFPDAAACQENIEGDIPIPDHPLIREVMKDVLHEALDLEGLKVVLDKLAAGEIRTVAVDTPVPSAFCHELLNANPFAFLDDAPLEERRARAVALRRIVPQTIVEEVGRLDPDAIATVAADAWPDVRDADELHDALQTLVVLPADRVAAWRPCFDALVLDGRAGVAWIDSRAYWIAAERARAVSALFPAARLDPAPVDLPGETPAKVDALTALVQGWMIHSGPRTAPELAADLGLGPGRVEEALLRLEASGVVLRGAFRGCGDALEFCERRLLARIHRLTIGRLRREIEPVSAAVYVRWLFTWQHVAPGTQLVGEHGTLDIVEQLQGFEAAANAWEPQLLSRRIRQYDPAVLDALCLSGTVGWGRLSPHPALGSAGGRGPRDRRVVPTSVAPMTFFVRAEADWLTPHGRRDAAAGGLTRQGREVLAALGQSGAMFFGDIVRSTRLLKAEVEQALWELVAAGLVTADGFDNLRALIDPRRRAGSGTGRHARPRHGTGRWALVHTAEAADRQTAIESTCRMLLRRYGVVFRDVLARETLAASWRELLVAFRRLEDRGDIRGGRFVSSFVGEQFALPLALESLRAARRTRPDGQVLTVSASDPLNLVGILVPGDRVAPATGRTVSFRDGAAVPVAEPVAALA
jgi:ATP-dependent Lhr-like helicase